MIALHVFAPALDLDKPGVVFSIPVSQDDPLPRAGEFFLVYSRVEGTEVETRHLLQCVPRLLNARSICAVAADTENIRDAYAVVMQQEKERPSNV